MLDRSRPAEIVTLDCACTEKGCGLPGSFFLLDHRTRGNGRQRCPHHAPVAEDILFAFLSRSVGNGVHIERMLDVIWSNNPGSQIGALLLPRRPTVGDVSPPFRTLLS